MKKILVIDDDADVAKLMKAKLEATNRFQVIFAAGGRVAVAMAQTELPDLIVCDIDMPDMDGGTVARTLAEKDVTKNIPLIFLSSIVSAEDVRKGARSGRWPVLSKEMAFPELLKSIESALGPYNPA